jgi:hypothetical protein
VREELIFLLNESAELEHSLACSYLFTAYSLKDQLDEGLTPDNLQIVRSWKREFTGVAVEEMFHLAVITDLLTAVGAAPHFDRPNFPHDCAYFLPDYQIELHAFDEATLEHFLAIEQPDGSNVPALRDPSRLQRVLGDLDNEIGPDPHHFDSQGDVYGAVLACLTDLVNRRGEENVFIGPPRSRALQDFLASSGWEPNVDLASTSRNLGQIVRQGEGASLENPDSHYARFGMIQRQYQDLRAKDSSFTPARPVVANPFTRTPPEWSGPVSLITDEFAIQVSDLFNETYGVMLQLLGRLFIASSETEEEAQALCDAAIDVMASVLTPLGNLLCRLPASSSNDGTTSGPSFVLRTVHSLPDKTAAWLILHERLQELSDYTRGLAGKGESLVLKAAADRLARVAQSLSIGLPAAE